MEGILEGSIALIALTMMEIVLGIDNIIYIAILTDRLPEDKQDSIRRLGLGIAMFMRIAMLLTLAKIMELTGAVFHLTDLGVPLDWIPKAHAEEVNGVSWRDIILILGGLFLLRQSVKEIHEQFHGDDEHHVPKQTTVPGVLLQIVIMDIIFSLDSVITAVGMAKKIQVMVLAIVIAVAVMMLFAGRVSRFVKENPTIKMLALSFLILIGVMLIAEGVGTEINKGYIYFAMAFSLIVEMLNIALRGRHSPPAAAEKAATTAKVPEGSD